jgi:predicted phage baseplate assembly protein
MPLPTPMLDDRHFQDIVDQAKLLIPRYCREWTDHNVSDPGVTLIELFAWMTDMLLYRVNQVPDKNYIKFLEMIGVRLEEPRPATAPVTFYLSAAQPADVTIPADTEVATVRTETSPAIIFTTKADLTIRPPSLIDVFTRNSSRSSKDSWTQHNVGKAELLGRRISIFPSKPGPQDAFFLAMQKDHSHHVLALILSCELAGGAGVDPNNPPIQWQVWQGGATRWATCELDYDGTGGFNESGEIILHLPAMAQRELQGLNAYWLRCILTDAQSGAGAYKVSPVLRSLRIEARGGTVNTHHAITVHNEVLGTSDGTPGQAFKLLHTPILALDPLQDSLIMEPPGGSGKPQSWQEVTDFADSGPEDRHFTLDKLDGTLTLGPSLLQPDGHIYRFGAVPDKGSLLRFSRYQYGGGVEGNVSRDTLSVLKSSIPYVARVTNRAAAVGGRDAQSLDDARLRAPQMLRTRTRAVTVDDYEYLTCQVPGVARACCLAPGPQPGDRNDPQPGQVFVIVLPQTDVPQGRIPLERLTLSAEMRSAILAHLNARRLLGTALEARQPQYIWVSVQAVLRVPERSDPALIIDVQRCAEEALYRYLNPYVGGPRGDGWPFGRALNRSEIYGLLQGIKNVEFVEDVQMSISESAGAVNPRPATGMRTVPVSRHGLICSDQHQVKVS